MLRILGLFICLFLLVGCGDGDKKLTDLIDEEVLEKTIDILEVVAEDKYF